MFLVICNQKLNGVLQGYPHVPFNVFILPFWCVLPISSLYTHVYNPAGHQLKSPSSHLHTGHNFITVRTVLFWVIMQQLAVTSYQCFGTACCSYLQGSRIQKESWSPWYRVYVGKSVGSDMFSVVWCQPVGLMQVEGREGGRKCCLSSMLN